MSKFPTKGQRVTASLLLVFAPVVVVALMLWEATADLRELVMDVLNADVRDIWKETKDLYRFLWAISRGRNPWN